MGAMLCAGPEAEYSTECWTSESRLDLDPGAAPRRNPESSEVGWVMEYGDSLVRGSEIRCGGDHWRRSWLGS